MLEQFHPQLIVPSLHELSVMTLAEYGVRGVMIDLDNTLAPWRSLEIAAEVEEWVVELRVAGLLGCVVTNAANIHRVQPVADRLGLPCITRANKPFASGFLRALQLLGTAPEHTAMIGDQLFTDIYGANRLGLFTVLVEPIMLTEEWTTRLLLRPLEQLIGRTPRFPAS
jgi:HAD superfamily phosphatase (TIGR01668 family)